jgi:hypothetical protein
MIKRQYLYLGNKMYYLPYKNDFICIIRERDESDKIFIKRVKYIRENLNNKTINEVILDSLCLKNTWLYGVTY